MSAPTRLLKSRALRLVFIAASAASLVVGLWGGLARIGLVIPNDADGLAERHAALIISGFLGTVISLERAVALAYWWAYLAPAFAAVGATALVAGLSAAAAVAFVCAGLALAANSAFVVRRQPALFTIVIAIAAACWLAGTVAWISGAGMAVVAGCWLSFLILTIAGERLELSRLLSPPRISQITLVLALALVVAGLTRGELASGEAWFSGIGLLATTAWLLRYDLALRTIRMSGQVRFTAACLIAGYVWLGVSGFLLLTVPPDAAVYSRDAVIHGIAIGFVISMIFGHAPIILPAVLGIRIPYGPAFYFPLIALHVSVLLRIVADLAENIEGRLWSGPITILALLGFAGTLFLLARRRPIQ